MYACNGPPVPPMQPNLAACSTIERTAQHMTVCLYTHTHLQAHICSGSKVEKIGPLGKNWYVGREVPVWRRVVYRAIVAATPQSVCVCESLLVLARCLQVGWVCWVRSTENIRQKLQWRGGRCHEPWVRTETPHRRWAGWANACVCVVCGKIGAI